MFTNESNQIRDDERLVPNKRYTADPTACHNLHGDQDFKMAAETTTDIKDAEGNPFAEESQSAFADGLMQIFKPAVEKLDDKVVSVKYCQVVF